MRLKDYSDFQVKCLHSQTTTKPAQNATGHDEALEKNLAPNGNFSDVTRVAGNDPEEGHSDMA